MHAVIMGGAGFVGLNIVEALLSRGARVTVMDRAPIPPAAARAFGVLPGQLRSVQAEISDRQAIDMAFSGGVDLVVLGAAITADSRRDAREPEAILGVNLMGILPVLEAARAVNARRVINLSSVAAMGRSVFESVPSGCLDENTPCRPESLYAITKFASEQVCARLASLWGLEVVSVRLSGVYGPWERFGGVRDTVSPHLQVMAALTRSEPVTFQQPGMRDWVYAVDVAEAVLALAEAPDLAHRLYNVSTAQRSSVLAFAQGLAEAGIADAGLAEAGLGSTGQVSVPALVTEGVDATIALHAAADRLPLCVRRIADDVGWQARFSPELARAHYGAWWRQHGGDMMGVA